MWYFFPRLCLCSVQVFFFVCETLSCSWLYRRRWDSSSWFRAAFHKIGRAQPVLIFCGHRLRLHPCALLLALQLLWGSLQHTHLRTFHILKSRCSAFVCLLADDLFLSTRISVCLLSENYIWPLLLELFHKSWRLTPHLLHSPSHHTTRQNRVYEVSVFFVLLLKGMFCQKTCSNKNSFVGGRDRKVGDESLWEEGWCIVLSFFLIFVPK